MPVPKIEKIMAKNKEGSLIRVHSNYELSEMYRTAIEDKGPKFPIRIENTRYGAAGVSVVTLQPERGKPAPGMSLWFFDSNSDPMSNLEVHGMLTNIMMENLPAGVGVQKNWCLKDGGAFNVIIEQVEGGVEIQYPCKTYLEALVCFWAQIVDKSKKKKTKRKAKKS